MSLKHIGLLATLGLTACQPASHAAGKWDEHTQGLPFVVGYESGRAAARKSGKPAMVFVTTTWCGWCKKLAKESFNDERIREALKERFVCVIVDGDSESDAARKLGARGFPHVVFQDAAGTRLEVVRGYRTARKFGAIVEQVLEKLEKRG